MTTAEKVQVLRDNIRSTVTLNRGGGEELQAYLTRVDGDGEDANCVFMDVLEGVERTLSVSQIEDVKSR